MEKAVLQCEMEDGSWWEIPLMIVIDHVAKIQVHYGLVSSVEEVKNAVERFQKDEAEIINWAEEYIEWEDMRPYASMIRPPAEKRYAESWRKSMKRVLK